MILLSTSTFLLSFSVDHWVFCRRENPHVFHPLAHTLCTHSTFFYRGCIRKSSSLEFHHTYCDTWHDLRFEVFFRNLDTRQTLYVLSFPVIKYSIDENTIRNGSSPAVSTVCTLFTLLTLFLLFILFKLLYTAETVACMPLNIVWKGERANWNNLISWYCKMFDGVDWVMGDTP